MPGPNDTIDGGHLAGLVRAALTARRTGAVALAAELERRACRAAWRRAEVLDRKAQGLRTRAVA